MAENKFLPENVLGEKICEYDRKQLCEFVSRLCERIREDTPSGTYRGGIFPNNISVDENGDVSVGEAALGAWKGQELEFLPPEIFWNGHAGSASDVYSLGLLLYFAVSGGKLPFNDSKEAQQRRMNGEDFSIPKSAGRRLGEIIRKATAFNARDRYSCPAELKAMLDSCVKNLYLNGEPSAVAVFGKSDDDLSDTERMMVEIIEKNNGIECDEPTEEEQAEDMSKKTENDNVTAKTEENAEPKAPDAKENTKPAESSEAAKAAPAESSTEKPIFRTTIPREPAKGGLDPINVNRPAVQYIKSAEREKNIKKKVRKKDRTRTALIIIALCLFLILLALIYKTFGDMLFKIDRGDTQQPQSTTQTPASADAEPAGEASMTIDDGPAATEEPAPTGEPEPTETPVPTEEPPKISEYSLHVADVSWEEAKQRCEEMGGYLAVISSQEELDKITELAENEGIRMLWVGCRRTDDKLEWVNGEQVDFWPWGEGEPSKIDAGDNVAEDYVLLWYFNGRWSYNDSRNDPVADYPGAYRGNIAFACEKEVPVQ